MEEPRWSHEELDAEAGPIIDREEVALVSDLVAKAAAGDDAAFDELADHGDLTLDQMMQAMRATRYSLEERSRVGTLLGRLGDPRLAEPLFLGPLVRVTASKFLMGGVPLEPEAETNALPQHDVDLPSYHLAKFHVTNAAFALFVADSGYEREELWLPEGWQWRTRAGIVEPMHWQRAPERPNHPVVGISWHEANAYCRWLALRLEELGELRPGEMVRLPTEAEWEKGARGGTVLDRRRGLQNSMPDRRFPWGNGLIPGVCNTVESGLGGTSPVGMFPESESPYRLDDMAGNVLDWCNSKPEAYPYNATDGREDVSGNPRAFRALRGGAWSLDENAARCAYRQWKRADFRGSNVGMRVVRGHAPA
jgi:formylglycine-generating enzyme required for sulfatase activity